MGTYVRVSALEYNASCSCVLIDSIVCCCVVDSFDMRSTMCPSVGWLVTYFIIHFKEVPYKLVRVVVFGCLYMIYSCTYL